MKEYKVEVNYDGNIFPMELEAEDKMDALGKGANKFLDALFEVTDEDEFEPELMHVTAEEVRILN